MARYNKPTSDGPSSEEKALDLFAEMMIEKSKALTKTGKSLGLQMVHCNGRRTLMAEIITV